jgi:hypothetical protein
MAADRSENMLFNVDDDGRAFGHDKDDNLRATAVAATTAVTKIVTSSPGRISVCTPDIHWP